MTLLSNPKDNSNGPSNGSGNSTANSFLRQSRFFRDNSFSASPCFEQQEHKGKHNISITHQNSYSLFPSLSQSRGSTPIRLRSHPYQQQHSSPCNHHFFTTANDLIVMQSNGAPYTINETSNVPQDIQKSDKAQQNPTQQNQFENNIGSKYNDINKGIIAQNAILSTTVTTVSVFSPTQVLISHSSGIIPTNHQVTQISTNSIQPSICTSIFPTGCTNNNETAFTLKQFPLSSSSNSESVNEVLKNDINNIQYGSFSNYLPTMQTTPQIGREAFQQPDYAQSIIQEGKKQILKSPKKYLKTIDEVSNKESSGMNYWEESKANILSSQHQDDQLITNKYLSCLKQFECTDVQNTSMNSMYPYNKELLPLSTTIDLNGSSKKNKTHENIQIPEYIPLSAVIEQSNKNETTELNKYCFNRNVTPSIPDNGVLQEKQLDLFNNFKNKQYDSSEKNNYSPRFNSYPSNQSFFQEKFPSQTQQKLSNKKNYFEIKDMKQPSFEQIEKFEKDVKESSQFQMNNNIKDSMEVKGLDVKYGDNYCEGVRTSMSQIQEKIDKVEQMKVEYIPFIQSRFEEMQSKLDRVNQQLSEEKRKNTKSERELDQQKQQQRKRDQALQTEAEEEKETEIEISQKEKDEELKKQIQFNSELSNKLNAEMAKNTLINQELQLEKANHNNLQAKVEKGHHKKADEKEEEQQNGIQEQLNSFKEFEHSLKVELSMNRELKERVAVQESELVKLRDLFCQGMSASTSNNKGDIEIQNKLIDAQRREVELSELVLELQKQLVKANQSLFSKQKLLDIQNKEISRIQDQLSLIHQQLNQSGDAKLSMKSQTELNRFNQEKGYQMGNSLVSLEQLHFLLKSKKNTEQSKSHSTKHHATQKGNQSTTLISRCDSLEDVKNVERYPQKKEQFDSNSQQGQQHEPISKHELESRKKLQQLYQSMLVGNKFKEKDSEYEEELSHNEPNLLHLDSQDYKMLQSIRNIQAQEQEGLLQKSVNFSTDEKDTRQKSKLTGLKLPNSNQQAYIQEKSSKGVQQNRRNERKGDSIEVEVQQKPSGSEGISDISTDKSMMASHDQGSEQKVNKKKFTTAWTQEVQEEKDIQIMSMNMNHKLMTFDEFYSEYHSNVSILGRNLLRDIIETQSNIELLNQKYSALVSDSKIDINYYEGSKIRKEMMQVGSEIQKLQDKLFVLRRKEKLILIQQYFKNQSIASDINQNNQASQTMIHYLNKEK